MGEVLGDSGNPGKGSRWPCVLRQELTPVLNSERGCSREGRGQVLGASVGTSGFGEAEHGSLLSWGGGWLGVSEAPARSWWWGGVVAHQSGCKPEGMLGPSWRSCRRRMTLRC